MFRLCCNQASWDVQKTYCMLKKSDLALPNSFDENSVRALVAAMRGYSSAGGIGTHEWLSCSSGELNAGASYAVWLASVSHLDGYTYGVIAGASPSRNQSQSLLSTARFSASASGNAATVTSSTTASPVALVVLLLLLRLLRKLCPVYL